MQAPRPHAHTRLDVRPWLHGEGVKKKPVDPLAKRPVPQYLEGRRMVAPARHGGERFGPHNAFAVGMRRRGHVRTPDIGPVVAGIFPVPELALRLVGPTGIRHVIAEIPVIRFDGQTQPAGVRQRPQMPGVVVLKQLRERQAQIPEESLRRLEAVHDAPGHHGQKGRHVITPPFFKFLAHPRGPVLRARLPAIDVRRDQRLPGERTGIGNQLLHQARKMDIHRLSAQAIHFQPHPRSGGWMVILPRRGVPKTKYDPLPFRHVPGQLPILKLRPQVHDPTRRHGLLGRNGRQLRSDARKFGQYRLGLEPRLPIDIRDAEFAVSRHRDRHHSDLPVIIFHRRRLRQGQLHMLRPLHRRLCPDHLLHRELRRDPRSGAPAPASIVGHVDLHPQTGRFGTNKLK